MFHFCTSLSRRRFLRKHGGFTIVELLVVIGIVSILIALLLPAVQQAREAARRLSCNNKLRQLSLALHNYASLHRVLPPGSQVVDFNVPPGYSKSFGWTVPILPFVEESQLYEKFDFNLDCQIHQRELTKQNLDAFICPSDPLAGVPVDWKRPGGPHSVFGRYYEGGWGTTNYFGISGISGLQPLQSVDDCERFNKLSERSSVHAGLFFGNSSVRFADITDGLSNTFMLAERGVVDDWGKWGGAGDLSRCPFGILDVVMPGVLGTLGGGGIREPKRASSDRLFLWSRHNGGCHYAIADGSVRFVSYSIDHELQLMLSTRDHGEIPGEW